MDNGNNIILSDESLDSVSSDDRPMSPVLKTSSLSQKVIYGRKRRRLKSKVNLANRYSLEQAILPVSSIKEELLPHVSDSKQKLSNNVLDDLTLLDNLNMGDKLRKIKEIEEKRRKFANYFYDNPKSLNSNDSNTNTPKLDSCSSFEFKKTISIKKVRKCTSNNLQNEEREELQLEQLKNCDYPCNNLKFDGFKTGSGKEITISRDLIEKHSTFFNDILKPEELAECLSKSIIHSSGFNNTTSPNASSLTTVLKTETCLHSPYTKVDGLPDAEVSIDFEAWSDAGFDTTISNKDNNHTISKKYLSANVNGDGFKGFKSISGENTVSDFYTTFIDNMEREISLLVNKMKSQTSSNKRSLSFTPKNCKRFKCNNDSTVISTISNLCFDGENNLIKFDKLKSDDEIDMNFQENIKIPEYQLNEILLNSELKTKVAFDEHLQKADGINLPIPNIALKISNTVPNFDNNKFKNSSIQFLGFQTAGGKTIQISNKALSKANNILQEINLPNINEKLPNLKNTEAINLNTGSAFSSKPDSASDQNIQKLNKVCNRAGDVLADENLRIMENKLIKNNIKQGISFHESVMGGFTLASGKEIKVSNKAINRAAGILREENLPDLCNSVIKNEMEVESISKKDNLNIDCSDTLSNLEDEFKTSFHLKENVSEGFKLASGKNIEVTSAAWMKANSLLNETNLPKLENTLNPITSSCTSKGSLNTKEDKKLEVLSDSKFITACEKDIIQPFVTLLKSEESNIPRMKSRQFQSPVMANSKNNSILARSDQESSPKLNNLHTPKNNIKASGKKRVGVSINKQIIVPKENIQKASLIFEEFQEDKPHATNLIPSNIFCSTPIKNTSIAGQSHMLELRNEKNCLSNVNITPIRYSSTCKDITTDVDTKVKISITPDENGAVVFKKNSLSTSLEHVDREYQFLEMQLQNLLHKKEILNSQRESLKNKSSYLKSQKQGVLTKKKLFNDKISWCLYLEHIKPGRFTVNEALEYGISNTILNVTPKNACDINFNCNRNKEIDSVIHTEDGAIVIANSNNLIGLAEIITAFEVMPGVDAKLLPRNWVSNHFKWIVWKLASLERNFPDKCANVLSVENLIQQLKYRYDREIDKAERPALRKILEKDDISQKKMVLCVADIREYSSNCFELELTDGWYSISTIIDKPLCNQVKKNKIVVGTKLITQCAELLNCEDGCHPLEISSNVRLKIFYNCTRRAKWDSKLGYQRVLEPFPINLNTILPDGGCVGCIKIIIARVYPVRYMEKEANGRTVLRNKNAEDKRVQEWESERAKAIEAVQHKIQSDFEMKKRSDIKLKSKVSIDKKFELSDCTDSPNVLFEIMQNTNDPEGFKSKLSASQLASVMDYELKDHHRKQQELSKRMDTELKNFKFIQRNVTPVLKLCVTDLNNIKEESEIGYVFIIYNPSEEHLQSITEGSTFFAYNVLPKHSGEIVATKNTHFKLTNAAVKLYNFQRSVIPIPLLQKSKKPIFNEFDTIGTIVELYKGDNSQHIWLTDCNGTLLFIKIIAGPSKCSLLENLNKGHSIAIMNLIYCTSKHNFAEAIANQCTLITRYPRHNSLQECLQEHTNQLPKDFTCFINECDKKIEMFKETVNTLQSCKNSSNPIMEPTNLCELFDDSNEDTLISSRLTTTDIAMSLIDTDQYFD